MHDLIIRGGTVVDGTGEPPRTADIAIDGNRVAEVGDLAGVAAHRTIDADGAIVAPGFVDVHAHYDGQATWDSRLLPSAWHGVTTVVFGNCGVGFAPVHTHHHNRLVELMEGVEDIPGTALHEGLSWAWESFEDYLDALDSRPHDIDFAAHVPHGALRLYVMGERGADHTERATAEEIGRMGELVRRGVAAGAVGFATSRTTNHKSSKGEPIPTLTAAREELVGIATEMGRTGKGVFQIVSDLGSMEDEFETFRTMMAVSGRPMSISLAGGRSAGGRTAGYHQILAAIDAAVADGFEMRAQVPTRAIGVLLGLQATLNPFMRCSTFKSSLAALGLADRVAAMRREDVREALLREVEAMAMYGDGTYHRIFSLGDPPDYEPPASASVDARARAAGVTPAELIYDLLLEDEGRALLYSPVLSWVDGNLDAVREMLVHPRTIPGLSDGGAHVGTICDGSFPTSLLTHWCRDRSRGERLDLAFAVKAQSRDTAVAVGLTDRGLLAPGFKADLNVIDFEGLTLHAPQMSYDLPAGGKRLLQKVDGYLHTIVSGQETYTNGTPTEALPGRLVRNFA